MSSSITSAITQGFTGVSKYASSLQSVLSRAVAIASLPLDSLNAGLNSLSARQSALQGLDTTFLTLQQSIGALQNTVKSGLLNSSISDAGVVSATLQQGALPGSYSIEVLDLGSYSTALSNSGTTRVTDIAAQGLSADATLTLHTGAVTTTISPATSSLGDLVEAINTQASDQVQATLVNVGSGSSPDYRLSLRAVNLGSDSIDLTDSTGSLVASASSGSAASYKVGGVPTPISSSTRTITLAPGITVNLLGKSASGNATTVNVLNSPAALTSALNSFATSYNAAVQAVSNQHGASGGALQGDSLLQSLSGILHQLGTYSNGGPATALANYGVTLDQSGRLSVNGTALIAAASSDFHGLLAILGSSNSGGFLKTATDLLGRVEDPVSGSITGAETSVAKSITAQQKRIADEQAVINGIQTSLTAQIARADASIASLQSQLSYVTGLFAAYNGTSSTTNGSTNG
jgi:flagellar hook-associated protein 2